MKKIAYSLLALTILSFSACSEKKADTGPQIPVIKIATQSPLSGGQAALGEQIKLGAQIAVEEAQDSFKALGFQLELAPYDDQANPDTGVANANRIINDPDILGVVGHYNSGVAIPSSEVYARVGLVMVSPANTNPRVTDRKLPNVNRICGRDDVQGPAGAEFAIKELKAKKVFIIHDKSAYGQGIAENFKIRAKELGVTVPDSAFVGTEEKTNFIPVITQVMAYKPDLIYAGGTYDMVAPFTKQLREHGLKMPILSDDGIESADYITQAGSANVADTYYTTVAGPVSMFPKAKDLADKFNKKFGKPIEGYGVYGYDCANVIINGIQAALKAAGNKKPTKEDVAKAVRAVNMEGLTGTITFDDKGDKPMADYYILKYAGTDSIADNKLLKTLSVAAPKAPQ